ncbi:MAG: hypothetical protein R6X32_08250 [Chloroflexota bacterium]|jgi:hypothetical protein
MSAFIRSVSEAMEESTADFSENFVMAHFSFSGEARLLLRID